MTHRIIHGHAIDALATLLEKSVQCCVTSPPYWGLRNYGIEPVTWGGDATCEHDWEEQVRKGMSGGPVDIAYPAKRPNGTGNMRIQPDTKHSFCRLCGAWRGCLGLESTPELYVAHIVECFRAVRRVLRDDGTLWVNMGDAYARPAGKGIKFRDTEKRPWHGQNPQKDMVGPDLPENLSDGDLLGMPWRVAFALQADGWRLRSAIVWAKGVSLNDRARAAMEDADDEQLEQLSLFEDVEVPQPGDDDEDEDKRWSGSVMPESVNGTRWERHKIKVRTARIPVGSTQHGCAPLSHRVGTDNPDHRAEWRDCPGCPKCQGKDGYVLRRGSWRPTSAYEMVFMFSKGDRYFAEAEAVREVGAIAAGSKAAKGSAERSGTNGVNSRPAEYAEYSGQRNVRNVWALGTEANSRAHYASYPEKLVEPIIRASTSKRACGTCGAAWAPVVEETEADMEHRRACGSDGTGNYLGAGKPAPAIGQSPGDVKRNILAGMNQREVAAYLPTCSCGTEYPIPQAELDADPTLLDDFEIEPPPPGHCMVLDPFCGTGTTGVVALREGCDFTGIDASAAYCEMARKRIEAQENCLPEAELLAGQATLWKEK